MDGNQYVNVSKRYLEHRILNSNSMELTMIQYEWLIENLQYIVNNFNLADLESFQSEQSLEKLDTAERVVENLYGSIAEFKEEYFQSMAKLYQEIVNGFIEFKRTHQLNLIRGAIIIVEGLKEAYEGVLEKGE